MVRTQIKTVAAAVILAAVSAGAVVGCRALYGGAGSVGTAAGAAAGAGVALASGEAGVKTIATQTQLAEKQVQKAMPHSDVRGQAYLEAASDAHGLTLVTTGHVEAALDAARGQVGALQQQLNKAIEQVQEERDEHAQLQSRWFVVWGQRIERWIWTAAITWLLVGIASVLLGTGTPLAWIAKIRGLLAAWRGVSTT